MDFFANLGSNIDLRDELHDLTHGAADVVSQGRDVIVRELTNQTCTACWDKTSGGSNNPHCRYCDGEGYMWRERIVKMIVFRGVAPVYKPGNLATGQYPEADFGYVSPDKSTAYCEWWIFPDYEKFTDDGMKRYDMLYELKVTGDGNTYYPLVRTAKWKMLTVTPIHGDNGRVEYFEIGMDKASL
jgi:hypothetical protein